MSLSRFERTLLASGASDGPSLERRRAARAALMRITAVSTMAAAATLTTAKAASGSAIGTATATTSAATATATSLKVIAMGKVVLIAALATGAVTAAAASISASVDSESPLAPTTTTAMAVVAAPRPSSPSPQPSAEADSTPIPTMDIDAIPSIAQPSKPPPSSSSTAPPVEDPLATEARLLEAARVCLAKGDRACSHARLAEYANRFGEGGSGRSGVLADEAAVLAIDVAIAEANRAEARRIARKLLASKPHGAWSSRVRALAEEEEERP